MTIAAFGVQFFASTEHAQNVRCLMTSWSLFTCLAMRAALPPGATPTHLRALNPGCRQCLLIPCSESAAADTSAGKGRRMRRWGSFPSGGGVGGGRFAARTVAVRSYHVSGVPPFLNQGVTWSPRPALPINSTTTE